MKTKKLLVLAFMAACGACLSVNPAFAQSWTQQTNAPGLAWTSVAASADGVKLAATAWSGQIYTSTDSGAAWTRAAGLPNNLWRTVATSADGSRLAAISYPNSLFANFRSTNSGLTWNAISNAPPDPSQAWTAIACSADGTTLAGAAEYSGQIYTSTNSGASWNTNNAPGAEWSSLAASADGSKLVAVQAGNGGGIYSSTNSGMTWLPTSAPIHWWTSVASSTDGTKLIAAVNNGGIYTSADSGASWLSNTVPTMNWTSVASSADGTKLVAAANGSIYTSFDSGISWDSNIVPHNSWTSVASSADGNKLVAVAAGGIWTAAIPINSQLKFVTNNGAITITGYTGPRGLVTIPSLTNGLPVTSIAAGAFQNNYNVAGVVIPNTVTNIGLYAFQGCDYLTLVTIPASVTGIGAVAFCNCRKLTAITVDPANLFYSSANGVLFNKDRTGLIQFPAGLGGSYAIPGSVTRVGTEAFFGCTLLTNVMVGNSVTNIGDLAFFASGPLTAITVEANNPAYSSVNGVLFDKDQTTLVTFPAGLGGSYTVPAGVTNILDYAFSYCNGLTEVTIPASVTRLEWSAFVFCGALTGVYFLGNAPDTGGFDPFALTDATVYYLPGTAGWSEFFADTSVTGVLWLPQVLTGDGDFGVRTNQFGFNITWAGGQTVVVEACTNLVNPVWQPVQTNTLTGDPVYVSDPQWTNYPGRFYRLRSP